MAKMRPRTRNVASPQVSSSSASGIERHRRRNSTNFMAPNVARLAFDAHMAQVRKLELSIPALDQEAMRRAAARQAELTKPAGSLGVLEELSIRLAGITGRLDPPLKDAVVFTLAADHGVASEGDSADGAQLPERRRGDQRARAARTRARRRGGHRRRC